MNELPAAGVILVMGLVFAWFVSRKGFDKAPLFLGALTVGVVYAAGNIAGYGDASLFEKGLAMVAYGACVGGVWFLAGGARR